MDHEFDLGIGNNSARRPYRTARRAAKDYIDNAFKSMIQVIDLQGSYI